jgi:hypothetical protein
MNGKGHSPTTDTPPHLAMLLRAPSAEGERDDAVRRVK